jgi:maltooligosyltrehalose trehalohydrolase
LAKPLVLIAESDLNDPIVVQRPEAGGHGLDAQWSDDFHHALHVLLTGERQGILQDFCGLPDVVRGLERGFVYEGQLSAFRERAHGRALENISLRRLIVCLQNHDQVGNRARGERIGHIVSSRRAQLGAALVLLGPFVPLLFQGEEWNASAPFLYFTDHRDPALGRAVSEGRRREFAAFGWPPDAVPDPQEPSTFRSSCLDFAELDQPEHAAFLDFYRALIQLRRERSELAASRVTTRFDERSGLLILERPTSWVALNFGPEPLSVPFATEAASAGVELLYAREGARLDGSALILPPEALAVVALGR